jgi:ferric-dicitrate binding protein FerR (iron transport regulator)
VVAGGDATSVATVLADQPPSNPRDRVATTTVSVTPPPEFNKTVNVAPASGTVTVRLPGSTSFVSLNDVTSLPTGTEVDAAAGVAAIVSARDASDVQQAGSFTGGRFIISYGTAGGVSVTQLQLSGLLSCPGRSAAAARPKKASRQLWGNAKGNFRTVGRYGAATIRGTEWQVEDTCRATTVRVRHGRVDVYDMLRGRHVFVTTGHSYTARRP